MDTTQVDCANLSHKGLVPQLLTSHSMGLVPHLRGFVPQLCEMYRILPNNRCYICIINAPDTMHSVVYVHCIGDIMLSVFAFICQKFDITVYTQHRTVRLGCPFVGPLQSRPLHKHTSAHITPPQPVRTVFQAAYARLYTLCCVC